MLMILILGILSCTYHHVPHRFSLVGVVLYFYFFCVTSIVGDGVNFYFLEWCLIFTVINNTPELPIWFLLMCRMCPYLLSLMLLIMLMFLEFGIWPNRSKIFSLLKVIRRVYIYCYPSKSCAFETYDPIDVFPDLGERRCFSQVTGLMWFLFAWRFE